MDSSGAGTDEVETGVGRETYACPFEGCGRVYTHRAHLDRHVRARHTQARPFVCTECGRAYTLRHNLRRHEATHLLPQPYACAFCEARFTKACHSVKHMLGEHGAAVDGLHKRVVAGMQEVAHAVDKALAPSAVGGEGTVILKGEVDAEGPDEEDVHTLVVCRRCPCCGYSAAYPVILREHVLACHYALYPRVFHEQPPRAALSQRQARRTIRPPPGPRTRGHAPCPVCGKMIYSSSLRRHIRAVHEGDPPHVCRACGEAFRSSGSLAKHRASGCPAVAPDAPRPADG